MLQMLKKIKMRKIFKLIREAILQNLFDFLGNYLIRVKL